jgi:hypothetical protein
MSSGETFCVLPETPHVFRHSLDAVNLAEQPREQRKPTERQWGAPISRRTRGWLSGGRRPRWRWGCMLPLEPRRDVKPRELWKDHHSLVAVRLRI